MATQVMAQRSQVDAALVVPLAQVGIGAVAQVGGKNASLGEMIRELSKEGVQVPGGFATTALAYRNLLSANKLVAPLKGLLAQLDTGDLQALQDAGLEARRLVLQTRALLHLRLGRTERNGHLPQQLRAARPHCHCPHLQGSQGHRKGRVQLPSARSQKSQGQAGASQRPEGTSPDCRSHPGQ